ncbi:immunoglobulin kappa light chain-like [Melospiza melodia melodia]|uniref:immunoglobulin kappa light chain-like n=1 Tax=Melospiza melodia melodia TaxID=1914991 RepID=UPI002FCEA5CD
MSAHVGGTVRITCSGASNNWYGWFQQKVPGTAPVTVIYDNTNRPSGIPSRFSGSQSGSTGTLTITGVQAEDEAVYFCGSYDGSVAQAFGYAIVAFGLPGLVFNSVLVPHLIWWPYLFSLTSPSPGSLVQAAAVTQPSSVSAKVGDTIRITCSGHKSHHSWYQQKVPGTGPVTVIYWKDHRPSGIPSRFSSSGGTSTGTLTITGVQAEDEAVYFCGSKDSSTQNTSICCRGSNNAYGWYQQKVPGTGPVTVIYNSNSRPSGIPSRFSGSTSGSTNTLTITGVQAEDEAVYFCGGEDSSSSA